MKESSKTELQTILEEYKHLIKKVVEHNAQSFWKRFKKIKL